MRIFTLTVAMAAALLLAACGAKVQKLDMSHDLAVPSPPREFRGVWISTVANIDWPSRPGIPVAQQRAEMAEILDRVAALNFNAIVLQVRPSCDAMYKSELEPWSHYLTGESGKAPEDPNYDPLTEWVQGAHARGLEVHAWFNPYRAGHPSQHGRGNNDKGTSAYAEDHIVNARPDLAKRYGSHYWMDPAEPEVQDHSFNVVMDVVRRYDIDGVHFDDYFYPYKERDANNQIIDFPDEPAWQRYVASGGTMTRNDWRRSHVDKFMQRIYEGIKAERPEVKFGLSPFGIWQPGYPEGIAGFNQYEELYADAKLWLNEGWVDYWTPQLYWPIAQLPQSYPRLLQWWIDENTHGRHVWPGLGSYKYTADNFEKGPAEVIDEIAITRGLGGTGNVHFTYNTFKNEKLAEMLTTTVYKNKALVPATPWLNNDVPATPSARVSGKLVRWQSVPDAIVWAVGEWRDEGANRGWQFTVLPRDTRRHNAGADVSRVAVFSVSRTGNTSAPAILTIP